MAETTKRTTTSNSTSKSRKSKNNIIRSTLGKYLKKKNYSMNEKFRKSDLALTQSIDEYELMMMLDNDTAKVNSILYSNDLCLSNNQSTVELQFSKFVKFVQSQSVPAIKSELQTLLWPLLCHIYIEMIKGINSRPATDFLRKYAYLIGPIENLYSPVVSQLNSNLAEDSSQQQNEAPSPPMPSSSTQILFSSDTKSAADQATTTISSKPITNEIEQNFNDINDYFKELTESLSLCLRIEETESIEIVRNFRAGKYEMVLSLQTLYAMKHFLIKSGHVIILHILQARCSFEIREALIDSDVDEEDLDDEDEDLDDEDEDIGELADDCTENDCSDISQPISDDEDSDYSNSRLKNANTEIKKLLAKVNAEVKTVNGLSSTVANIDDASIIDVDDFDKNYAFPISPTADSPTMVDSSRPNFRIVQNKYLQNVRAAVIRSTKMESPMRVFNILNADHQLSSCDVDTNECHLVCGFDDSTIKLWQLNQSKIRGKKPFSSFSHRLCDWSLENCESSSSEDSDIETDNVDKGNSVPAVGLFGKRPPTVTHRLHGSTIRTNRKSKCEQRREFMGLRCEENIYTDGGYLALRGHNKGVTDVLLSKYNPLLFSVSKDNTMRAWKASDYRCAAIYRGHNYPIWCIAESSTGLYLATGSRDLTARLWSTDREHILQTYIGHTQDVDAIAFHPNGNYIATGSNDLTVRLWDVTSGKLLRVFIDCHLPVQCVSFSPDGKYLAAAGEESKIRIFDLAAGSQLTELKDHSADINSIVWNSTGSKIASCCADGSLRVYSINNIFQNSATARTQSPIASTSASSSSSSSSSNSKLLISNETGCKRAVKVFFNIDDTVSCIGNS